ncbi:Hypothetical predicted protein [Octopus vulgaris]|uniref:Uncharacterized protein n=1 Tax=Octopus vulgaris TaxID=6645 RepID=A0AA36AJB2_OCTVU|nr:Hypothetical predicted protein [Octopus vulgaris]
MVIEILLKPFNRSTLVQVSYDLAIVMGTGGYFESEYHDFIPSIAFLHLKCQGHFVKVVGIELISPSFSHGHIYVVCSHIRIKRQFSTEHQTAVQEMLSNTDFVLDKWTQANERAAMRSFDLLDKAAEFSSKHILPPLRSTPKPKSLNGKW